MLLYRNKSNQYDIIDLIDFLKSINGLMDEANFFSYQPVGLEREENSWKIFARTSVIQGIPTRVSRLGNIFTNFHVNYSLRRELPKISSFIR